LMPSGDSVYSFHAAHATTYITMVLRRSTMDSTWLISAMKTHPSRKIALLLSLCLPSPAHEKHSSRQTLQPVVVREVKVITRRLDRATRASARALHVGDCRPRNCRRRPDAFGRKAKLGYITARYAHYDCCIVRGKSSRQTLQD
jgi:hypothetical protein